MGEAVYMSEVLEMDYGDLPGMDRYRQDVLRLPVANRDFHSLMKGYQYQLDQTEKLHKRGEVRRVEREYPGHSGAKRRADIEKPTGEFIDCKAYRTNYNPPQHKKLEFLGQAQDYATSGRTVIYYFSQDPPQWVKDILDPLGLRWEIHAWASDDEED